MACSKCGCNICILSYNPTNCYTGCPIISVVNITDLHIASLQICCHLWKTGLSLHLSQVVMKCTDISISKTLMPIEYANNLRLFFIETPRKMTMNLLLM